MRITAEPGIGLHMAGRGAAVMEPKRSPDAEEPLRTALPALIPNENRQQASEQRPNARPAAALLAQLVAGAENLPDARARRRADPTQGADLYRSVAALKAPALRPALRIV